MKMEALRSLLKNSIDMIDNGTCSLTEDELEQAIDSLSSIVQPQDKLSKYQACKYLGISRATFDNLVRDNKLPKGRKEQGFKELFWYKKDLICK